MTDDRERTNAMDAPLEDALRAALADRVASSGRAVPSSRAWDEIQRRRQRRAGASSRWTIAVVGIAAAVLLVLGTVVLIRGTQESGLDMISPPPAPKLTNEIISVESTTTTVPPSTTTTAPPLSMRDVDLRNFAYPKQACPEHFRPAADSFTLVDGRAEFLSEPDRGVQYPLSGALAAVSYGDVTGDGQEDAIVRMQCSVPQSDGVEYGLAVVSPVGAQPTVIAAFARSGFPKTVTYQVPESQAGPRQATEQLPEDPKEIRVVNGRLVVTWWQTRKFGGSPYDRLAIVGYRWNGQAFAPEGQPQFRPIPPPGSARLAGVSPQAVRSHDFRSLRIASEPTEFGAPVTCLWWLRQPFKSDIAEPTLHDGHADLTDLAGRPLGASVDLESVQFGDVTGDGIEEALVVLRCTYGGRSVRTLTILGPGSGEPTFYAGSIWIRVYSSTSELRYSLYDVESVQIRPGQEFPIEVVMAGRTADIFGANPSGGSAVRATVPLRLNGMQLFHDQDPVAEEIPG